jgi:pimeloyl-ACP methyl ester carboxylesterase
MSSEETRAHLRASARHDVWERLAQVEASTLVLHGTDDLMSPVANAHVLASRIPTARLHLVRGGRHGFFEEYRAEFVPLIREFFS